jgi:hypothetical protein
MEARVSKILRMKTYSKNSSLLLFPYLLFFLMVSLLIHGFSLIVLYYLFANLFFFLFYFLDLMDDGEYLIRIYVGT